MSHQPDLHPLYAAHLETVKTHADRALERAGRAHLVIAAGQPSLDFLDDQGPRFAVNPHFKHWLPLTKAPGSWIVYTPGARPKLVFLQPYDYWHVVPAAPAGYWVEHFDIVTIREAGEAATHLPADAAACAIIGAPEAALPGWQPDNPQALLDYLHYHRAYKTPYEIALMRVANQFAARAHLAARTAFQAGASEFDINLAYMQAARQFQDELPYGNIIGLNEHGAVLHYGHFDRVPPAEMRSLLIDAGASFHGYASDITRTWVGEDADGFQALVDAVEGAQLGFNDRVRAGQDYGALHVHAHHVLAEVLIEHGVVKMSAEAAVASGVSAVFFPHGLGHLIGLQVHDAGGFLASEQGGTRPRPDGHPYLRLTRTLEPGMVVTIEPGLYFIDLLLEELKARPEANSIDWARVDALRKYGGVRIEDDVLCTEGEPENLSRDAFAAVERDAG